MPAATAEKKAALSTERAELHAAITHRLKAEAGRNRQLEAITRAKDAIGRCDVEQATEEAALAKKRQENVARAATAIRDETVIGASGEDAVHRSIEAIKDRRRLLVEAEAQLEADLVQFEIDLALAKNVVVVAATKVAAPLYAARMARIRELRLELLKDRVVMATLMTDITVEFPNDARSFFPAREAERARLEAREAACGPFLREAKTDAAYLATMPAAHTTAEYGVVLQAASKWKGAFERLLDDANAELSEKI
jgi:hypothetical protein